MEARLGLPLPNVWLGVSAENQAAMDDRLGHLLGTPAAVRFISYEPALGPVDWSWLTEFCREPNGEVHMRDEYERRATMPPPIEWLIVGCESGPNARETKLEWVRSIRDQCQAAGVAFFMKQMSRKGPIPDDLMVREFPA